MPCKYAEWWAMSSKFFFTAFQSHWLNQLLHFFCYSKFTFAGNFERTQVNKRSFEPSCFTSVILINSQTQRQTDLFAFMCCLHMKHTLYVKILFTQCINWLRNQNGHGGKKAQEKKWLNTVNTENEIEMRIRVVISTRDWSIPEFSCSNTLRSIFRWNCGALKKGISLNLIRFECPMDTIMCPFTLTVTFTQHTGKCNNKKSHILYLFRLWNEIYDRVDALKSPRQIYLIRF